MIDYLSAIIDYLRPRVSYAVGETAGPGGVAVTLAGGGVEEYVGGAAEYRATLDLTALGSSQVNALAMLHAAHAALATMPPDHEAPQYRFRATAGVSVESLPSAVDVDDGGKTYAVQSTVAVSCTDTEIT